MRLDVYAEYLGEELLAGVLDTDDNEGFTYSSDWLDGGPGDPFPCRSPCRKNASGIAR